MAGGANTPLTPDPVSNSCAAPQEASATVSTPVSSSSSSSSDSRDRATNPFLRLNQQTSTGATTLQEVSNIQNVAMETDGGLEENVSPVLVCIGAETVALAKVSEL